MKLVLSSLKCGAVLCIILVALAQTSSLLLFVSTVPGLAYGILLVADRGDAPITPTREILFILLSGGVYMVAFWLSIEPRPFGVSWLNEELKFMLATSFGAVALFGVYYWLVNPRLRWWVGLAGAVLAGAIGGLPAVLSLHLAPEFDRVVLFLTYPLWQILFAAVVHLASVKSSKAKLA